MDRTITWGVLATCAGLAACAGTSNDIAVIVPTTGSLDSALPFGATNGVPEDMLSADLVNGAVNNEATITFNTDGSYSIGLPGGGGTVTVTSAAFISDGPAFDPQLSTTSTTFDIGTYIVDVHLGEDAVGSDLFILARVENGPTPETLAFAVFGDETALASLPVGDGVAYSGGFVSDVFDSFGGPVSQMSGTATITANFAAGNVDVVLNQTDDITNSTLSGIGLTLTGAQYTGAITSTGGVTAFDGIVQGAFYGPGAEGTAGVFYAEDVSGGVGNELEVIGGFTGLQ